MVTVNVIKLQLDIHVLVNVKISGITMVVMKKFAQLLDNVVFMIMKHVYGHINI